MTENQKCRNCSIELEKGFIPDHSHLVTFQSSWIRGEPKEAPEVLLMKMAGIESPKASEGLKIEAYRCPQCGLLEFYAKDITNE